MTSTTERLSTARAVLMRRLSAWAGGTSEPLTLTPLQLSGAITEYIEALVKDDKVNFPPQPTSTHFRLAQAREKLHTLEKANARETGLLLGPHLDRVELARWVLEYHDHADDGCCLVEETVQRALDQLIVCDGHNPLMTPDG